MIQFLISHQDQLAWLGVVLAGLLAALAAARFLSTRFGDPVRRDERANRDEVFDRVDPPARSSHLVGLGDLFEKKLKAIRDRLDEVEESECPSGSRGLDDLVREIRSRLEKLEDAVLSRLEELELRVEGGDEHDDWGFEDTQDELEEHDERILEVRARLEKIEEAQRRQAAVNDQALATLLAPPPAKGQTVGLVPPSPTTCPSGTFLAPNSWWTTTGAIPATGTWNFNGSVPFEGSRPGPNFQ